MATAAPGRPPTVGGMLPSVPSLAPTRDDDPPAPLSHRLRWSGAGAGRRYSRGVPDAFDAEAMVDRFRQRARAVRDRGIPPIEGPARASFVEQAQLDYMDFAMLGDADASLDDGILILRIDLRPPEHRDSGT